MCYLCMPKEHPYLPQASKTARAPLCYSDLKGRCQHVSPTARLDSTLRGDDRLVSDARGSQSERLAPTQYATLGVTLPVALLS